MSWISRDMQCCGVTEIAGLVDHASPEEALKDLLGAGRNHYDGKLAQSWAPDRKPKYNTLGILVFTEVSRSKDDTHGTYGRDLAKFIKENDLGFVKKSHPTMNPNHADPDDSHIITAFFWTPNVPKLYNWWKEKCKPVKPPKSSAELSNHWW